MDDDFVDCNSPADATPAPAPTPTSALDLPLASPSPPVQEDEVVWYPTEDELREEALHVANAERVRVKKIIGKELRRVLKEPGSYSKGYANVLLTCCYDQSILQEYVSECQAHYPGFPISVISATVIQVDTATWLKMLRAPHVPKNTAGERPPWFVQGLSEWQRQRAAAAAAAA